MIEETNKAKTDIERSAAEAVKVITQAAEAAAQRLASAANEATRVVASAASEAVKVSSARTSDDHDLLIRISEKVDGLKGDVKDLKDGTSIKIADHEKRIGAIELEQSLVSGTSQGSISMWGYVAWAILMLIAMAGVVLTVIHVTKP